MSKTIKRKPLMERTLITPEMAQKIIDNVDDYKKTHFTKRRVDYYAKEMKNGKWIQDDFCDPITIDNKGVLVNGFYRLMAVIQSKKDIFFYVLTINSSEPRNRVHLFQV